jgi:hypothetical protein
MIKQTKKETKTMIFKITQQKLSDGSINWDVVLADQSGSKLIVGCFSEMDAIAFVHGMAELIANRTIETFDENGARSVRYVSQNSGALMCPKCGGKFAPRHHEFCADCSVDGAFVELHPAKA